jgi:hypothetical protein
MFKFLKNLFFGGTQEEVFYECDTKITVNKRENSIVIDTIRDLSDREIKEIMDRYL